MLDQSLPPVAPWQPKVTALVPCYNSAAFVTRALDSLAAQTWPNLEILIGEDCSTDNTFDIVTAFAATRGNVRVLRRSENLGWLRNANDLMANATGELMFFAFHDDAVEPSYVEKLVAALRDNPGAVLAYTDMQLFQPDGSGEIKVFDALAAAHTPLARGLVMGGLVTDWWLPNRGLFRSWAFARAGGIKPNAEGEFSADWTWLLHLSLLGDFVRVPETLCRKYFQKTSLSRNWAFSPAQRRALRQAGMREVWNSRLDLPRRAVLAVYIGLNLARLGVLWRRATAPTGR
ncbi:glycosyltransferase family 2 protein [Devosia sp. LjRoot16]|uniref:glycosyltransferase family 2 protein n=1 Tax=unclassified Devosia TaxID=196773 RepID=UPI000A77D7EE|nr:glycosyltransferase family 2 protein [Devosia sp. Root105]